MAVDYAFCEKCEEKSELGFAEARRSFNGKQALSNL